MADNQIIPRGSGGLSSSIRSGVTTRDGIILFVRELLRDRADVNSLLDGVETSDTIIGMCIELAADDFTNTPPLIGRYTADRVPANILVLGTLIWVLRSAGFLQSRNQLDYSDGGISIRVSDKTSLYQSWIAQMMQEYEAKKLSHKKAVNASYAYGGIHSEYVYYAYYGTQFGGIGPIALQRFGLF
jgi:hypothetical protein